MKPLTPHQEDEIARAVFQLAGPDLAAPVPLSPEAIARSKAAASRGEFATDEQMRAAWFKHGYETASTREFEPLPIYCCNIPMAGALTDDPTIRPMTTTPYPYVIFCEVTDDEVVIHAMRPGARDPYDIPGSTWGLHARAMNAQAPKREVGRRILRPTHSVPVLSGDAPLSHLEVLG